MMMDVQPPALVAPAETRETLTLDEAIALALRQNPNLIVAAAQVVEAQGRTAQASATLRPAFSITANVTGFDRSQNAAFTLPGLPPLSFRTAPKDQSQLLLNADIPIDASGQIRRTVEQAKIGQRVTEQQQRALRNQIIVRVQDSFYSVLQTRELVKVAEEAVRNAEEQEKTAESYVQAGVTTRYETLRAATATADARQNLLVARNRVTLSMATLANTLGLTPSAPLAITPPEMAVPFLVSFEAAINEATENRPELQAAVSQIRAADLGIRLAADSDAPTVGVSGQYQRSPRPGFGQAADLAALNLRITIPLYDRGISKAQIEQAHARKNGAEASYKAILNDIQLELQQTLLASQEARDRLSVASAAVSQAQEQYRLAQNRYKAGVNIRGDIASPLLEINDARIALTEAQTNLVNARFDVLKAQARFEAALGRYSRKEVKP